MHVQSCCFGYKAYCFFDVLIAIAVAFLKLPTHAISNKWSGITVLLKTSKKYC